MNSGSIEAVVARHTRQWLAIPDVLGTATGQHDGRPCILVFVAKKTPELAHKIPSMVDGYPVVLEETGAIRALKADPGRPPPESGAGDDFPSA